LIAALAPTYKMPCRQTLTKLIEKKHQEEKEKLVKQMEVLEFVSLTSDVWTSNFTQKGFQTTTVHFIDANNQLVSRVLQTNDFNLRQHTGEEIALSIKSTLKQFKLYDKGKLNEINKYILYISI
jgi:hypothetical protein